MSSKRRSTRERTVPSKYFKESSSEDEGDDDKTKAAKLKLKEMMNDDSDQESDFEKEIQDKQITSSDSEVSEVSEDRQHYPVPAIHDDGLIILQSPLSDHLSSQPGRRLGGEYRQDAQAEKSGDCLERLQ